MPLRNHPASYKVDTPSSPLDSGTLVKPTPHPIKRAIRELWGRLRRAKRPQSVQSESPVLSAGRSSFPRDYVADTVVDATHRDGGDTCGAFPSPFPDPTLPQLSKDGQGIPVLYQATPHGIVDGPGATSNIEPAQKDGLEASHQNTQLSELDPLISRHSPALGGFSASLKDPVISTHKDFEECNDGNDSPAVVLRPILRRSQDRLKSSKPLRISWEDQVRVPAVEDTPSTQYFDPLQEEECDVRGSHSDRKTSLNEVDPVASGPDTLHGDVIAFDYSQAPAETRTDRPDSPEEWPSNIQKAPRPRMLELPELGVRDELSGQLFPAVDVNTQMDRYHACVSKQVVGDGQVEYTIRGRIYGYGSSQLVSATARYLHSSQPVLEDVAIKVFSKEMIYLFRNSRNGLGKAEVATELKNMIHVARYSAGKTGLVPLRHSFEDEENIYLVMPFFPLSLRSLLQYDFLGNDRRELREIMAELILALEVLHTHCHMAHRDIKPENILLDKDGRFSLCDFGMSYQFKTPTDRMCSYNGGTTLYFPPEVKVLYEGIGDEKDEWTYDGYAADVWSLGCVFHELATGGCTYERANGHGYGDGIVWHSIVKQDKDLADILLCMLDPRPEQRITIANLKQHAFFRKSNWENVRSVVRPDNIRPQNTNPLANYPRATFQDLAIERGVYALVGASRDPNIGKFWENEKGTWDW